MYRAKVNFSGIVSMTMDEVREISDPSIVADLLRAGYIEEIKVEKPEKKPATRKKKK